MSNGNTTKERLVRLETLMTECKRLISNHLQHSWELSLAIIAALILESVGLIFLIIKINLLE